MREIPQPESGPKKKLLDSAEQLFAERGFESVSVRDITQVVKMNIAAVNYHFGSREELLMRVVMRHVVPVCDERLARLDTVERKGSGKALPLEELIDAYVRPLLGHGRKPAMNERLYHRLMGRIFGAMGDGLPAAVDERQQVVEERFARAFAKALPGLAVEERAARIHFMRGGLIHLLTHFDALAAGAIGMEGALTRFIRFAVAGMKDGVEVEVPVEKGPQGMFNF